MGVSDRDPIMSTVDISFSPAYSVSSSIGTSGCKKWSVAQHLEYSRKHFIALKREQILEEAAQGEGEHLDALASLMACPDSSRETFKKTLHSHYSELQENWKYPVEESRMLMKITDWTATEPLLQQSCKIL